MKYRLPDEIKVQAIAILEEHKHFIDTLRNSNEVFRLMTEEVLDHTYKTGEIFEWFKEFNKALPNQTSIGNVHLTSISGINKTIFVYANRLTGGCPFLGEWKIDSSFNYLGKISLVPVKIRNTRSTLIHELAHAWMDHETSAPAMDESKPYAISISDYYISQKEFDAEGCAIRDRIESASSLELQQIELWVKNDGKDPHKMDWLSRYIKYWMQDQNRKEQLLETLNHELAAI